MNILKVHFLRYTLESSKERDAILRKYYDNTCLSARKLIRDFFTLFTVDNIFFLVPIMIINIFFLSEIFSKFTELILFFRVSSNLWRQSLKIVFKDSLWRQENDKSLCLKEVDSLAQYSQNQNLFFCISLCVMRSTIYIFKMACRNFTIYILFSNQNTESCSDDYYWYLSLILDRLDVL